MSRDELIQVLLSRLDKFESKLDSFSDRISALEIKEEVRQSDRRWISRQIKIISAIISSGISIITFILPKFFN